MGNCSCRRGAASTTTTAIPPASTPPPAQVVSPPPSAAPALLPLLAPSSSASQPTAAASEVPSTASIPTQVTSQGELDEDTCSNHGTGSQYGSVSKDSQHPEEEQQKSGSDFAYENVEEEEESTKEEDDKLSAEESVPVRLSRAQKGKQKIDERSNALLLTSKYALIPMPTEVSHVNVHPMLTVNWKTHYTTDNQSHEVVAVDIPMMKEFDTQMRILYPQVSYAQLDGLREERFSCWLREHQQPVQITSEFDQPNLVRADVGAEELDGAECRMSNIDSKMLDVEENAQHDYVDRSDGFTTSASEG
ncbi:Uncharacterized protein Fot_24599 [Forsythia ovata]|uniref:Uncharacterized protein n=1 Tax=Forsythia ovata TaxID=205694 RepID=A0ABD1U6N4_9LAMI